MAPPSVRIRSAWQMALLAAGLTLAIAAAARPQWGTREEVVFRRSRDVLVLLDVSRSMLADDVHPNRLARAKADLMDMIRELRGDRVGLMAFRQKAALICPLTTDYAYFAQALDAAGPWSAPRGETDIGDAIGKAMETLSADTTGSHQAMILVSDGEDLSGKAVDAAKKAGERGVAIFTVGLGNRNGSRIPDPDRRGAFASYRGEEIVTRLHNDTLLAIADAAGGKYVPLEITSTARTTLGSIYRDHLRRLTTREMEESLERRRVERFHLFLFPAVVLMLGSLFLSRGRLATGPMVARESRVRSPKANGPALRDMNPPKRAPRALQVVPFVIGLALLPANGVLAQAATPGPPNGGTEIAATTDPASNGASNAPALLPSGRAGAWSAGRLYAAGRYGESADAYLQAARTLAGSAAAKCRFNAAIALYRAKRFDEAAEVFGEMALSESQKRRDEAFSGLGASLAADRPASKDDQEAAEKRSRRLQKSAEAFRDAVAEGSGSSLADLGTILEKLPEAAEAALIEKLNREYAGSSADALAMQMLVDQRAISLEAAAAFTNDTPDQIGLLESLAARQKTNAERWIPLKGKLLQALQAAGARDEEARKKATEIQQTIEVARDAMTGTSRRLRDLDPAAAPASEKCEAAMYQMWKAIAPFAPVLQEDLRRQTNSALLSAAGKQDAGLAEQTEARDLTGLFSERFSAMVPETGLPAPQPSQQLPSGTGAEQTTNAAPLISAETRKKALDLAARAGEQQQAAIRALNDGKNDDRASAQAEAERLLREIMDLLPKDKNQGRDNKRDQQQNRQDDQEQQQDQQQNQPRPDRQDRQQEPEDTGEKQPQEKKDVPEDARQMMRKALQRESEHEDELRRRMETIPISPHERDW
jgi:Ca-activated chloride channel family protein